MPEWNIIEGDCRDRLPLIESASIDAVICDPPYPCIKRSYGTLTEAEWVAMMDVVVPECRRVLKPQGSAVFVLQPNSERLGRMRTWLWDFMAKWGREWGVVQDAYWWNIAAMPEAHAIQGKLMRPSLKACVWMGESNCYRDQDSCLWGESESNATKRKKFAFGHASHPARSAFPSGQGVTHAAIHATAERRGGVTPFNVIPVANTDSQSSSGFSGHGAGTPRKLCAWWVKYISPPGGTVLDPFNGAGTVGVAAVSLGRNYVGIEQHAEYCDISRNRIAASSPAPSLFSPEADH